MLILTVRPMCRVLIEVGAFFTREENNRKLYDTLKNYAAISYFSEATTR